MTENTDVAQLTKPDNAVSRDTYGSNGIVYNYERYPKFIETVKYYFSLNPVVNFYNEIRAKSGKTKVLDMGSGVGVESSVFRDNLPGSEVISLEISDEGANKGKKNFQLKQIQGDIAFPPIASESIDAIHCKDVLVHVSDKKNFFDEMSRILKTDGVVLLVSSKVTWEFLGQHAWTLKGLKRRAAKSGLYLESFEDITMEKDDWYSSNHKRAFMIFRKVKSWPNKNRKD